jgi:hypothetical protein
MSFVFKWMELDIKLLSEISQVQKAQFCMFSLICEPTLIWKMVVIMIIMGHECERGVVLGSINMRGMVKRKTTEMEEDQNTLHVCG